MIPERRLEVEEAHASAKGIAAKPRPGLGRYVVRLVITVGIGLFTVSRFAAAAQAGYRLDAVHSQLTVAAANEASLEAQVAKLTATQHLASEAAKLKLQPTSDVLAVSVPAQQSKKATPRPVVAHHSGLLAAIGAVIQAIANGVARM